LFARLYDRLSAAAEAAGLRAFREQLLAGACGHVLEIGAGTGANLPLYPAGVETITVAEPEAPMAAKLAARVEGEAGRSARDGARQALPPDARFDAVVSTLVLCTVTDQSRALAEIRRVRTRRSMPVLEHVRAEAKSPPGKTTERPRAVHAVRLQLQPVHRRAIRDAG
jgi:ubiquinone/menaquinone biosynthesis C-methylase UbiE